MPDIGPPEIDVYISQLACVATRLETRCYFCAQRVRGEEHRQNAAQAGFEYLLVKPADSRIPSLYSIRRRLASIARRTGHPDLSPVLAHPNGERFREANAVGAAIEPVSPGPYWDTRQGATPVIEAPRPSKPEFQCAVFELGRLHACGSRLMRGRPTSPKQNAVVKRLSRGVQIDDRDLIAIGHGGSSASTSSLVFARTRSLIARIFIVTIHIRRILPTPEKQSPEAVGDRPHHNQSISARV